MNETEQNRTDALIAAVWRAVARALGSERYWTLDEKERAVKAAQHVEEMLRLTAKLYQK